MSKDEPVGGITMAKIDSIRPTNEAAPEEEPVKETVAEAPADQQEDSAGGEIVDAFLDDQVRVALTGSRRSSWAGPRRHRTMTIFPAKPPSP